MIWYSNQDRKDKIISIFHHLMWIIFWGGFLRATYLSGFSRVTFLTMGYFCIFLSQLLHVLVPTFCQTHLPLHASYCFRRHFRILKRISCIFLTVKLFLLTWVGGHFLTLQAISSKINPILSNQNNINIIVTFYSPIISIGFA